MLGYTYINSSKKFIAISIFAIISLCIVKHLLNNDHKHNTKDNLPIILWWTPFMVENEKAVTCGKHECLFTIDRTYVNHPNLASYLFYGSDVKLDDLPLPKTDVPWAIYHEESPKNLAFFLHEKGQKLFDITSTFSRNSHFPIPLQHLERFDLLKDLRYFVPVDEKNELNIAPVLYIQSDCNTPIERDYYVEELMKYIKVDSYGKCLNNKKLPDQFKINGFYDLYEDNFMKFVAKYKFTIAIENAVCNDYITEKLWRPLIVGSVPIYLGAPTVKDWLPNNKSVILIDDFKTLKDLGDYIKILNSNDGLYSEYLHHKLTKSDKEMKTNQLLLDYSKNVQDFEWIPAFECYLCENMHTKDYLKEKLRTPVYECQEPVAKRPDGNFWMYHWNIGRCEAKVLDRYINTLKLKSFTKEKLDKDSFTSYNENDC